MLVSFGEEEKISKLFRQEVMDKKSSRHLGDVFLSAPLSFWGITILMATIIAGIVLIGVYGKYTRKERVLGTVTPSEGLVLIMTSQPGSYEDVFVATGDIVQLGTPLLKIKGDIVMKDGEQLTNTLLMQMENEKATLQNRLSEVPTQYFLTNKRLKTRKKALNDEASRYLDQSEIQARTVELHRSTFDKMTALFTDGAASALEVSAAENRFLDATTDFNSIRNTYEKTLSEVRDIDVQISLNPLQQSAVVSEIEGSISSLNQKITLADAEGSSIMRAPIAGTIATVTARKGQKILTQKSAISILPTNGKLQVDLYVPTRSVGFVKKGQTVRLLYDAFPYQKYGIYEGTISEVSKTVIQSSDLLIGPKLTEPVFLVTVDVKRQSIEVLGDTFPLQAGMSLSADIVLEERRIWEWVFEPILGAMQ